MMKDSLKYMAYIIVAVFIFLTVRTLFVKRGPEEVEIVRYDTIWKEAKPIVLPPIIKDSIIKKTVYVPVPVVGDNDTITDTVYAEIPLTQKHYCYPDTLDMWITGYGVSVDSLIVQQHHEAHYTNTITDKGKWFNCYIGTDLNYLFNNWNYSLYFEANATIRKRATIGAKAGFMIYNDGAMPFIGATLKYKLN